MEIALIAAGCFWGVEEAFRMLPGVLETEVGYTGGHTDNPTYKDVCSDTTGHAEALKIVFDPEIISYTEILKKFFSIHDATQVNRQGPDVGSRYRSAIFFTTPEQEAEAKDVFDEEQKAHTKTLATEIVSASTFYPAEEYHQKYFLKNGGGTCYL
ncbi:MAG: peptide-methionine (S)-S-oxide reductase MsrA [Candidatus Pacebacteria bacterium]|nr:peptide-methionine (S)-S-oxide reductase MsrA [Candidatus Paceibacterota bacterium]